MIVREFLDNDLVRTYSDQGMYIHGGFPEADYEEAIDPISMNREYIETNIPIPPLEPEPGTEENRMQDMETALKILGVSE